MDVHLFLPLLSLFMSIVMQYFVNSNLHVSTLYTIIIPKATEFENLNIVQLQLQVRLTHIISISIMYNPETIVKS
jgi:hypothetical protein